MKKIFFALILAALATYTYVNKFNPDKATNYITRHSLRTSHNCCAWYVMKALWAGGKPVCILPAYGYQYLLPNIGFNEVSRENYIPEKGDIVVFPKIKGHIYRHIAMWTGTQWVSDFKQKGLIVSKGYESSDYHYYRYKE